MNAAQQTKSKLQVLRKMYSSEIITGTLRVCLARAARGVSKYHLLYFVEGILIYLNMYTFTEFLVSFRNTALLPLLF